jgi:hypothetical protein
MLGRHRHANWTRTHYQNVLVHTFLPFGSGCRSVTILPLRSVWLGLRCGLDRLGGTSRVSLTLDVPLLAVSTRPFVASVKTAFNDFVRNIQVRT